MSKVGRGAYGAHLPCKFVSVRDGDTVVLDVQPLGLLSLGGSSIRVAIRLIDCWCAELSSGDPKAIKARDESRRLCESATDMSVEIPRGKATFDRVVGIVWLDDNVTLNETLVSMGLATKKKPKKK